MPLPHTTKHHNINSFFNFTLGALNKKMTNKSRTKFLEIEICLNDIVNVAGQLICLKFWGLSEILQQ